MKRKWYVVKIKHILVTVWLLLLLGCSAGSASPSQTLAGTSPSLAVLVETPTLTPEIGGIPASTLPVKRLAPSGEPIQSPEGVDLDVTFINRSPMYQAYCVSYPNDVPGQPGIPFLCPGSEDDRRWPDPGEIVTFTAHVVNKGTLLSPMAEYAWAIDGGIVATGTLPTLSPGAEMTATYQWPWLHSLSADGQRLYGDHTVRFTIDPDNTIVETYEGNNSLEDPTNAMSLMMYITPEMYAAYNIPVTDSLPYSAEDWLQKQIAAMNHLFAGSIYPTTPDGATLRVRINAIEITSTVPDVDYVHDGRWFVDADYRHGASGGYELATDIDWSLLHELSHQISIIDLYASNIYATSVQVLGAQGQPTHFGFDWPRPDLMGGGDISPHTNPNLYSSHGAGGVSTLKGYRNGYYGAYQFDIPEQNYIKILNAEGSPAAGVEVTFYQRTGPQDWTGNTLMDNTPEITGTTDMQGLFLLPNRPANGGTNTKNGHLLHDNPFGVVDIIGVQNRFLIHIGKEDHEEFHWMDITEFNLAYWAGDTVSHTYVISSHVPANGALISPDITSFRAEGGRASLCWNVVPGAAGYQIYRAGAPDYLYTPAVGLVDGSCYDEEVPDSYSGTIYVVKAVDGEGHPSGFSPAVWVPRLIHPASVVAMSGGERIVLDPQNGYALVRQGSDGGYLQVLNSVHYHLENSWFMAADDNGHLLFSHPGDWYESRHSVRVSFLDASPFIEFGERGSGSGQFETPAGVAFWGEGLSIEGPITNDNHTLLLLHFDGAYTGVQGELGTFSGTQFASGRYDQGLEVGSMDVLTYTAAGNINPIQGSIEFWLRPNWDGDDGQGYIFFEAGEPETWENRMRLAKDGANNLRFIVWDSTGSEHGVSYNIAHWQAGEWHHVAATWVGGEIALYVDGTHKEATSGFVPPDRLEFLYVGMSAWKDGQVNAVIDELRISDGPRLGNSECCSRIIVSDSGNHRIQAFDTLGYFIASYGGPGNGVGQFDNPQGLAVDRSGRVLVVDSNNNRIVVLSFDGENFSYFDNYTVGFNAPASVAVGPDDHIFVADTGNNRIVELEAGGNFVTAYSMPNDGYTGSFNAPHGVAVDDAGTIIVADTGNRRVVTIVRPQNPWLLYLPIIRN